MSPTYDVKGVAVKNLGAQCYSLDAPGYRVPVRQQPWLETVAMARECPLNFRCFSRTKKLFKILKYKYKSMTGIKTLFLHCMSNLATSEVSLPTLFSATHRYSPLSVLFTLVMVNCVLFAEKLILKLSLVFTGDPFSVQ